VHFCAVTPSARPIICLNSIYVFASALCGFSLTLAECVCFAEAFVPWGECQLNGFPGGARGGIYYIASTAATSFDNNAAFS
jgi:hypothetical protein